MGVEWMTVGADTTEDEVSEHMKDYKKKLSDGHSVAFVIRKGALEYDQKVKYESIGDISREEAIEYIVEAAGEDLIVCTTGKASRELFEIRERRHEGHDKDFLTIGSMGLASSIALGIALNTNKRVWCIDGDGALLMHMGAMGTIGSVKPEKLVYVVLNNGAHGSVGGMPTVGNIMNVPMIAGACRYEWTHSLKDFVELKEVLSTIKTINHLTLIEIKCRSCSRKDLGRPTIVLRDYRKTLKLF